MLKSLDAIKKAHTGHFFDKKTMQFFSSRISSKVYPVVDGAYFVTSERDHVRRLYSVRFCDDSGNINTFGKFGEYGSATAAHHNAKDRATHHR